MRSWLFVPGNRPKMMEKAARSGADVVILDLEDSVAPDEKENARRNTAEALENLERTSEIWVRVNPVSIAHCTADLAVAIEGNAQGVVLPKSETGDTVRRLIDMSGGVCPPILAIATETAQSLFGLGNYGGLGTQLAGLAWGAEDLSADLGSSSSRDELGHLSGPFAMARNMMLAGAVAAKCQPVDTVWTDIHDLEGLEQECNEARRDGFTGKMAIHPAQVPVINKCFQPSIKEVDLARRIVSSFERAPGQGAVNIDGRMVDLPHLKRATRILASAEKYGVIS